MAPVYGAPLSTIQEATPHNSPSPPINRCVTVIPPMDSSAQRSVLVTGGSGFIGQHLVSALLARGRRVRVLDVRPQKPALPQVQYLAGSASDPKMVATALAGIDEIYHLAAMPGMWTQNKQDFDLTNRVPTEIMLTAARKYGVARFLHCSTESILFPSGAITTELITEEAKTSMEEMPGVYTRSKKAAEELSLQAAAEGLPVVIANPTMPIGPHGYELTPPTAMIRHFLGRSIRFHINGIMNIVDVRDVATGLVLVMERGQIGERYILGGENTSLARLLDIIAGLSGHASRRICLPMLVASRVAAIMEFAADHWSHRPPLATIEGIEIAHRSRPMSSDKARCELGYTTRPLREAVSDTVLWLKHAQSYA
jgi:nucleoside-diphosphate-sugar epimerase